MVKLVVCEYSDLDRDLKNMQKSATLNRFVKPNKRRDKIYLVLFYSDAIGHKNDDLCQFYGKVTFYGVLCGTGRFNPNPLTYV